MNYLRKKSFAKINLFLKIKGKIENYHDLVSLITLIDLHDNIEIRKSNKFSIKIISEFASLINKENNIFIEILNFFKRKYDIDNNLEIILEKNIPVSAGLGGGSSNAATFMLMINDMFNLNLSNKDLQNISLNFGSDIYFFLENKACIIEGRGDIIRPIKKFDSKEILIINPRIELPTKNVFKNNKVISNNFDFNLNTNSIDLVDAIKNYDNDLTYSATDIVNEIDIIINNLYKYGAYCAKMSGSGASCFAIFKNLAELDYCYDVFKNKFPNFYIKKSKIIYSALDE